MTKDELQAKREVALSELKNIEVALCLDEHYIDIIEKENAELKSEKGCEICTKFDEVKLAQAKRYLKQALPYLENIDEESDELYDEINEFIKEIDK